jgi:hypothetical protein
MDTLFIALAIVAATSVVIFLFVIEPRMKSHD